MDTKQCLNKIIGLTDTDCDCYLSSETPDGYNESESGLYLTSGTHGIPIDFVQASEGCEVNLWDILTKAREDGISKFLIDLGKAVGRKKNQLNSWQGWIGESKITSKVKRKGYVFWRISPFVGATIEVSEISLYMCCDGAVDILVYSDSDFDNPISIITVNAVSGEFVTVPTDLCTSLTNGNDPICLYIGYKVPDGCEVPNTKLFSCDCGFNTKKSKHRFLNFFNVESLTVNQLEDLEECKNYCSKYSNGIRIKACVSCDMSGWLCSIDYTKSVGDEILREVVAKTIQLASIRCLGEVLLDNPKCTPYALIASEVLPDKLRVIEDDYDNNIIWLANNLPNHYKSCYECKTRYGKKSII